MTVGRDAGTAGEALEAAALDEADPHALPPEELKRFITAEARAGELVTMTVAESIRRPGMSATFNCEGMDLGRKPSNKTQTAPTPGSRS